MREPYLWLTALQALRLPKIPTQITTQTTREKANGRVTVRPTPAQYHRSADQRGWLCKPLMPARLMVLAGH